MRDGKIKYAALLLILIAFHGCRNATVYSENIKMENRVWNRTIKAEFNPVITDTVTGVNIDFFLRTGSDYPFRNIYLFITTITPGGYMRTDTIEYFLSDERGFRYGSGVGDIREVSLPFRKNVRFSETGNYRFIVEQGMRRDDLAGLYDLGLVIKKENNSK